eukprot:819934-Pelagomonas_calceolata.AAC.6
MQQSAPNFVTATNSSCALLPLMLFCLSFFLSFQPCPCCAPCLLFQVRLCWNCNCRCGGGINILGLCMLLYQPSVAVTITDQVQLSPFGHPISPSVGQTLLPREVKVSTVLHVP